MSEHHYCSACKTVHYDKAACPSVSIDGSAARSGGPEIERSEVGGVQTAVVRINAVASSIDYMIPAADEVMAGLMRRWRDGLSSTAKALTAVANNSGEVTDKPNTTAG